VLVLAEHGFLGALEESAEGDDRKAALMAYSDWAEEQGQNGLSMALHYCLVHDLFPASMAFKWWWRKKPGSMWAECRPGELPVAVFRRLPGAAKQEMVWCATLRDAFLVLGEALEFIGRMRYRESLYRAILEDPYDELARSAYADCLEEEGDGHCWEVRNGGEKTTFADGTVAQCWRRGFVWRIVTTKQWLEEAFRLFRSHPVVSFGLADVSLSTTDREPGFRDYWLIERRLNPALMFLDGFLRWSEWWETKEGLEDELSRSLVAFGRHKAGLPPLKERGEEKV